MQISVQLASSLIEAYNLVGAIWYKFVWCRRNHIGLGNIFPCIPKKGTRNMKHENALKFIKHKQMWYKICAH